MAMGKKLLEELRKEVEQDEKLAAAEREESLRVEKFGSIENEEAMLRDARLPPKQMHGRGGRR